jgi:ABC-2 type transport system permease protein
MKRFLGFVTKEFYHIFRDKRSDVHPLWDAHRSNHVVRFAITNEINNVNIAILDKSRHRNGNNNQQNQCFSVFPYQTDD